MTVLNMFIFNIYKRIVWVILRTILFCFYENLSCFIDKIKILAYNKYMNESSYVHAFKLQDNKLYKREIVLRFVTVQ